jgi:flagellar protein FliO/FliZ
MDLIEILRALFGLAFVVGLIALCAYAARRWPLASGFPLGGKPRGRLSVTERLALDPRRQIVIVQEGAREHVILLGSSSECLIESREVPRAPLRLIEPGPGP